MRPAAGTIVAAVMSAWLAASAAPPQAQSTPETAPHEATSHLIAGLIGSRHDFAPPNAPLIDHCIACHGRDEQARLLGQFSYDAESQDRPTDALLQTATQAAMPTVQPTPADVAASQPTGERVEPAADGAEDRHANRGQREANTSDVRRDWPGRRSTARTVADEEAHRPARDELHRSTRLCLGCHDGTIASRIELGQPVSEHVASARVNFRHDHPVGVAYPRTDRGYHPAARVRRQGIRLPDGRVECVSCHDPHNTWGQPAMLAASNRRSALCLTCHIK